jgi:hypothetical protein
MRKLLYILLLSLCWKSLFSQTPYPTDYFRSPMGGSMELSGNFGEIRPNHFHAGFDLKTDGKENIPIFAAADGYISRIKISTTGYGKALYITHPNGFTSVYAHLNCFDIDIEAFTKKMQYKLETFELDTILSPTHLPIKKGELIALSGNTGGSQGPHLHFEIRDSKTEMPVNPYYFGYLINDTIKPRVTKLAIYPLDETSSVNKKNTAKQIIPIYKKGKYSFLKTDSITVNGTIGFGIECFDLETKSTNPNGVFSIELLVDGKRVYYHELEKFTFEYSRFVNAHIDYAERQTHGSKIQKCFLSKNNQLGIYKDVIDDGKIIFNDDTTHLVTYLVKDYFGNTTEINLKVKSTTQTIIKPTKNTFVLNNCIETKSFNYPEAIITVPANAAYDDYVFNYTKSIQSKGFYSNLHKIMNTKTALQKSVSIRLKSINLPDSLTTKACIVSINDKGKRSYVGGEYTAGWIEAKTKSWGDFAISIDTIAPKLRPAFKFQKDSLIIDLTKEKQIGVIASDDLSGIKNYRATIDGKWVLCEYETKKNLLFCTFDEQYQAGVHTFNIEVLDDKNNRATYTFLFKKE